jgi:hypothetical protein
MHAVAELRPPRRFWPFIPRWLRVLLLLGALLSLGLGTGWWGGWRKRVVSPGHDAADLLAVEDPRQTYLTPYRNVRPEVQYVGDEVCSRCHPRHAQSYRQHPMGRSLAPIRSTAAVERYDEAGRNPFDEPGFRYQVQRRGNQVIHREALLDSRGDVVAATEAEVEYVVGSGNRGRSYLINRDGRLFQSPITWYRQKQMWGLSPSYAQRNRHFSRPITAECLFCHSNRVLEVEQTLNGFQPPIFQGYAIGCERCHGPGELHVRRQEQAEAYEGPDETIVNPRHLEPALREAVCQQCHLQGKYRVLRYGRHTFDYRPGLPLHLFRTVFVQPPSTSAATKFIGQVEQMAVSRCFHASGGGLGCISCHDPHVLPTPERRVTYYRDRCLSCHADRGCNLPPGARRKQSPDDSCIECHMPAAGTEITHVSLTDHRILRQPDPGVKTPVPAAPPSGAISLVHFHHDLPGADNPGVSRDLAVALMDVAERSPQPSQGPLSETVLEWLDAALQAHPDDLEACHAKAVALWGLGRKAEATAAFDVVLAKAPRRETTLHAAANLAMETGRLSAARTYWERALEVNPYRYGFHHGLAAQLAQTGSWAAAARSCQRALELNPANLEVRRLLVHCFIELGDEERARAEFEGLLAVNPPDAEILRRWFHERVKRGPTR